MTDVAMDLNRQHVRDAHDQSDKGHQDAGAASSGTGWGRWVQMAGSERESTTLLVLQELDAPAQITIM